MKEKATELMALAAQVRDEPYAREAIAKGFELVAEVMRGDCACEDCGNKDKAPREETDETLQVQGA